MLIIEDIVYYKKVAIFAIEWGYYLAIWKIQQVYQVKRKDFLKGTD